MFKRKKSAIDPNSTDTLIGEGSTFEGKLKSEAGIRIEGRIHGDIECAGDVVIGERGQAKSNIAARNVTISGTVNGNVICSGTLTVNPTGKLLGNSTAQTLIVAEGALFVGSSQMEKAKAEAGVKELEERPGA
jgi:cytoskeletal protein CcmA (bactofilin family)